MGAKKKSAKKAPDGRPLVIVESPAKARTIGKFLGNDYEVQASVGHVRDLPQKKSDLSPTLQKNKHATLGVDVDNDFTPLYVVPAAKKDQIANLKKLLANAPELLLATDEDREGESISWHLVEVLKPKVPIRRLVFHEITKRAIQEAIDNPREIDQDMVKAQESRRILDRLFGYRVSELLWRKIRPKLSAGRVQSVALRLLVEREMDRIAFVKASYWDIAATFHADKEGGTAFAADLIEVDGKRIAQGRDFDPMTGKLTAKALDAGIQVIDGERAKQIATALKGQAGTVKSVEEKPYTRNPSAPFTTSTLQQEAGRKLRFNTQRTMRLAQALYENGAITYMRTDSTNLSGEAIGAARTLIQKQYGDAYLPDAPRTYKTKVKNAQEAHEAIRPAGSTFRTIEDVRADKNFNADHARLYELIWKRTVASQMANARGRRMRVLMQVGDNTFRASGSTIEFPGYQRAYVEGSDDPDAKLGSQERLLPPLQENGTVHTAELEAAGHETQPPARFTEASLVKELDTRGIGRPSTWASIIAVLLQRDYAFKKGSALVPSYTAFAVVRMLVQHFGEVLDYDFTAKMEDELDSIALGKLESRVYLKRFYNGNGAPGLDDLIQQSFDNVDPRNICGFPLGTHEDKTIEMRVGKYGLFLSDGDTRASVPEDIVPDELTVNRAVELIEEAARGPVALGQHPETKEDIFVLSGPYGPYVQLGEVVDGGEKPKRASLLKGMTPETLDLAMALRLLSLPRDLGAHPEMEGNPHVEALVGRYGPYVKCGKESRSIPAEISVLDITLEQAVELIKQPRRRGGAAATPPLRELGEHPESKKAVVIKKGRYGPYVTDGEINASLPRDMEPSDLTMDEAVVLLLKRAERIAAGGGRKKKKKKAKKKGRKKAAKKKATKKKAKKSAKKKAAKKAPASKPDTDA